MRSLTLSVAVLLAAGTLLAQRQRFTINTETPEGQLLQQIGEQEDPVQKLALLEKFAAAYPNHEAIPWVYAHMVRVAAKANQFDKALEAGEKALSLDPEDLETAHEALKAAEAKKDPATLIAWAGKVSAAARKVAAKPKPKEEDEVEDWKTATDFAKQLDVYTEYSLYALALQTTNPQQRIQLTEALEKQNPDSQYLPQIANLRFVAYLQTGQADKAVALAEKVLEKDQSNEDMLLAVADSYRLQKKDPDKVLAYCAKARELVATKPKPEGVSDQAWETRKRQITGRAHYLAGMTHVARNNWAEADKELRAALPGIADNPTMNAEALFYLGLANFRLGEKDCDPARILDAVNFTKQSAAIKSPYQAPARQNLKAFQAKCVVR
jgi:tetratricopeptide (TPR) repeat protein